VVASGDGIDDVERRSHRVACRARLAPPEDFRFDRRDLAV
jgi:hypothetical protein